MRASVWGVHVIEGEAMSGQADLTGSLTTSERSTLIGTWFGWMLDGMDVMIFSFVMPTLIGLWSISAGEAGTLGTSTLLFSAVGGWLAGIAADRYGRVKVLQISILWFAFFTFLSGFTDTFGQLLVTRSLMGLGFGGEWAVGSVLMAEAIRGRHRGKAVGFVQGGWAIGWGLAALCYTITFSVLEPALAWRVMFWIGLTPALLVFYIRGRVPESEVFRRRTAPASALGIFRAGVIGTTVLASLVALGVQGGYYAVTTWLPLFLRTTRGLSVMSTGGNLAVIILGAFCGYLTAAYLTDRLGRRPTIFIFAGGAIVTVCLYTLVELADAEILAMGFPLGFFASGAFSPIGSFFSELFPTSVRATGQGFAYNFGRGVGALFPALVGVLTTSQWSLPVSIAVFAASAYCLMIVATLLLPETRGRALE